MIKHEIYTRFSLKFPRIALHGLKVSLQLLTVKLYGNVSKLHRPWILRLEKKNSLQQAAVASCMRMHSQSANCRSSILPYPHLERAMHPQTPVSHATSAEEGVSQYQASQTSLGDSLDADRMKTRI